jgi:hypothetical protein
MIVRKFDEQKERVETGPIQFGNDWPGIFIRGDNALWFAFLLKGFLDGTIPKEDVVSMMQLRGFLSDLYSCNVTLPKEE